MELEETKEPKYPEPVELSNSLEKAKNSLETLKAELISNLGQVSPEEKQLTGYETYDYEQLAKAAHLASQVQDIKERKKYSIYIFLLICVWLIAVLAIVVLVGLGKLTLSENVILALIGSTTFNITGFFYAVTKYLFPNNNSKSGK